MATLGTGLEHRKLPVKTYPDGMEELLPLKRIIVQALSVFPSIEPDDPGVEAVRALGPKVVGSRADHVDASQVIHEVTDPDHGNFPHMALDLHCGFVQRRLR